MNLTDITQAFESGDFARPNLFEVEIPYLGKTFKLKCKAATMPASTVEKVPVGYMNRKLNIAGDRIYDDWTITVYNDDAHDTRKALLNWSNQAHGRGDAITGETPAQYKKTALVRQFHRNGQTVTHEETIQGLWPTNIGELQYDWDSNNEVSTFECTFAIDWVD
ncbi:tail protein [Morganella phage vB_MmoM_MP1]|uniref:Tail tube protein n=1 Tax=Morganella phage vB_MmoM_MP1 TaxID=1852628 RepID=A0A192YBK4_9CAUD|nr:tail protein [Morganella phage vB_MmoM_MP1]ANM46495.1 tail tube protein [Morganella phage vB_MmoM_MP1]